MPRHALRITVLRRLLADDGHGNKRGAFVEVFEVNGAWRAVSAAKRVEAGLVSDAVQGVLMVRDGVNARTLTNRDRVIMQGDEYAIESVAPRDRQARSIALTLSRAKGG